MAVGRAPLFSSRQGSRRFLCLLLSCAIFTFFVMTLSVAAVFAVDLLLFRPYAQTSCSLFDEECQLNEHRKLAAASIRGGETSGNAAEFKEAVELHGQALDQVAVGEQPKADVEKAVPTGPKVAFLYMTSGLIPLERLWMRFFKDHENEYSVWVHSSDAELEFTPDWLATTLFVNRQIKTQQLNWDDMSTLEVERRLVKKALEDPYNEWFILISETAIPIRDFTFIRNYLLKSKYSLVDSKPAGGAQSKERWGPNMMPEIPQDKFRKGTQWFAIHRRHARAFVEDDILYTKFDQCKVEGTGKRCYYPEEHYLQTMLNFRDPAGISNYSAVYMDWSGPGWQAREFHGADINNRQIEHIQRSIIGGVKRADGEPAIPLFAERFNPDSLESLLNIDKDVFGY